MIAHYLTVTDLELLASQVVKVLAIVVLTGASIINVVKALKPQSAKYKVGRIAISVGLIVVSLFILKWVLIEGSLLSSDQYVVGTTIGICQVFIRGQGIEFEYQVENKTYRNCNTAHPIPMSEIDVSGGEYYVRYSATYPDRGRMDFHKPVQQ
jgi:hypothetical protein